MPFVRNVRWECFVGYFVKDRSCRQREPLALVLNVGSPAFVEVVGMQYFGEFTIEDYLA